MSFVKVYGSILDSSVWSETSDTRIVWLTLLAMADGDGFVEAGIRGLARRANVSEAAVEVALAVFMAPDVDSKSPVEEGRRVRRVDRGFLVINHRFYRDLRTPEQLDAAARAKKYRAQNIVTRHENHTESHGIQLEAEEEAEVEVEKKEDYYRAMSRDRLDSFLASWDFGKHRQAVEGFIRSSRSPMAVLAELENHLTGEMGQPKTDPALVGWALNQYLASGERELKAPYFAGFVRRARGTQARQREEAAVKSQLAEEKATQHAERQGHAFVEKFKTDHAARYEALERTAAAAVPDQVTVGRAFLIHAKLVELIRQELNA